MTTDEQLEADIAKMRAEREDDRKIEELLQLDEEAVKWLHVHHNTHRSLLVSRRQESYPKHLEHFQLPELLKKIAPWTVAAERVKDPMFSPTWMPLPINFSNNKGQGKVIGLATVCLSQHGGKGFNSQRISVWLDLGPLGYLDVQCDVDIPPSWRGYNHIGGYSAQTGEPCGCEAHPPKVELPGQEYHWNRTTNGTYDLRAHWATLEGFIRDWGCLR